MAGILHVNANEPIYIDTGNRKKIITGQIIVIQSQCTIRNVK